MPDLIFFSLIKYNINPYSVMRRSGDTHILEMGWQMELSVAYSPIVISGCMRARADIPGKVEDFSKYFLLLNSSAENSL